jgi:hypothetical protein
MEGNFLSADIDDDDDIKKPVKWIRQRMRPYSPAAMLKYSIRITPGGYIYLTAYIGFSSARYSQLFIQQKVIDLIAKMMANVIKYYTVLPVCHLYWIVYYDQLFLIFFKNFVCVCNGIKSTTWPKFQTFYFILFKKKFTLLISAYINKVDKFLPFVRLCIQSCVQVSLAGKWLCMFLF